MLYEAVCWRPNQQHPPIEEILAIPVLAKLLEGWGREGDTAVIAELEDGSPVGAAWYRFWTPENHSYGFVYTNTPELGIAVRKEARQRGIGTALLKALIEQARGSGISQISLSVEPENYSRLMYEKFGFMKVGTEGASWTMLLELNRAIQTETK
jgi:ribosomal protein S18 acetylase RimI-like enzyme